LIDKEFEVAKSNGILLKASTAAVGIESRKFSGDSVVDLLGGDTYCPTQTPAATNLFAC
jgi:hypothetical protein